MFAFSEGHFGGYSTLYNKNTSILLAVARQAHETIENTEEHQAMKHEAKRRRAPIVCDTRNK